MAFWVLLNIMLQAIFLFVYECDNIALTRDTMKTLFIGDQKNYITVQASKNTRKSGRRGKTIESNRSQNIMQPSKIKCREVINRRRVQIKNVNTFPLFIYFDFSQADYI